MAPTPRVLTILSALLGLIVPVGAHGQSARVQATATVVEGVAAGWVVGAEPVSGELGGGRSATPDAPHVRGSLRHSGPASRHVTVSVRADEAGTVGTMVPRADLLISVDGTPFRPLGTDRVEIGATRRGDRSQTVLYRLRDPASRATPGERGSHSVDVVYTITLIGS